MAWILLTTACNIDQSQLCRQITISTLTESAYIGSTAYNSDQSVALHPFFTSVGSTKLFKVLAYFTDYNSNNARLTQSSGKGVILSHMTEGPVSCRYLEKRRSNPSNCFRISYTVPIILTNPVLHHKNRLHKKMPQNSTVNVVASNTIKLCDIYWKVKTSATYYIEFAHWYYFLRAQQSWKWPIAVYEQK